MALIQDAILPRPFLNPVDVCSQCLVAHDDHLICFQLSPDALPLLGAALIGDRTKSLSTHKFADFKGPVAYKYLRADDYGWPWRMALPP